MRVLIVGATGYVGRHVVAEAGVAGHDVVAHVRPDTESGDRAAAELVGLGARVIRTPWTPEAWYRLLEREQPDVLLLLLGTTAARSRAARRTGNADVSQRTVDLDLTMMVITAANTASPESGVIYLSALGASATGNEYLRVRASVETALRSSRNPFSVVRPSFITGADRVERRYAERIGARVVDGFCLVLRAIGRQRLAARVAPISGSALAKILVGLAAAPLDRGVHELDDYRS